MLNIFKQVYNIVNIKVERERDGLEPELILHLPNDFFERIIFRSMKYLVQGSSQIRIDFSYINSNYWKSLSMCLYNVIFYYHL